MRERQGGQCHEEPEDQGQNAGEHRAPCEDFRFRHRELDVLPHPHGRQKRKSPQRNSEEGVSKGGKAPETVLF